MPDSMDKAPKTHSSHQDDIHIDHRPDAPFAQALTHEAVQRALHTPSALLATDLLALQHTVGNTAVQHMLADREALHPPHSAPTPVVQAKLNVGPADDKYEREADRVTEQIMNSAPTVAASSPPGVQRTEVEDEEELQRKPEAVIVTQRVQRTEVEDDEELQRKPEAVIVTQRVQRTEVEDEEELQRKPEAVIVTQRVQRKNRSKQEQAQTTPTVGLEGGVIGGDLEHAIHNSGGGEMLPDRIRRKLEPKLGADLTHIRIHTDSRAAALNRQINAKAFTHDNHIYYGAGQSPADLRLTAHETVHTIQQGATPQNMAQRTPRHKDNSDVLQRYSAKIFKSSSSVNWLAETVEVKGSSEGAAGGVRFFKGAAGPVTNVVVKPHYGNDANEGRAQFQHTLINTMGLTAPESRIISLGSREGKAIAATAKAKNAEIPTELVEEMGMVEGEEGKKLRFIQIMGRAEGTSVASMTSKTESIKDVDKVIEQLSSTSLLVKIGKLIAVDVFSGNTDRINTNKTNLGNLMVEADRLTAIDNEINVSDVNVVSAGGRLRLMNLGELFTSAKPYATNYVKNIVASIFLGTGKRNDESQQQYETRRQTLSDHVDQAKLVRAWSPWIERGIREGRVEIMDLLTNKERKRERRGLKKQAGKYGSEGSTSYEGMKQQAEYLRLRHGGEDNKTATAKVGDYKTKRGSFKQRAKRWFG